MFNNLKKYMGLVMILGTKYIELLSLPLAVFTFYISQHHILCVVIFFLIRCLFRYLLFLIHFILPLTSFDILFFDQYKYFWENYVKLVKYKFISFYFYKFHRTK
uniref:Uncharacterized protein n=1 Tax=Lutzomyia longipalpis TaxID=7200 RepID=A0A7G3B7G9_LUTLO